MAESPIGRRYSTANIYALLELGLWLQKHEPEVFDDAHREAGDPVAWCDAWIENDPGDNGGDPYPRRQLRPDWPAVRDDFSNALAEVPRWPEVQDRAFDAVRDRLNALKPGRTVMT